MVSKAKDCYTRAMADHEVEDSIISGLFFGEIDEDKLFPFPYPTKEERDDAREMAKASASFLREKVDSEKFDQEQEIPREIIDEMAQMGLLGMGVPADLGGMGLNYGTYLRLFEELAGFDASVGAFLGAHQSIGYRALVNEGTQEQKAKWLPSLASGEKIAAFCLTEPSSGSDVNSIQTRAQKNDDGSYTITGQKLWITNAGIADFYTVFCKTGERISAIVVERGAEGFSFGEKENKMGIRASDTRALFFDKVKVPAENLLGKEGDGFRIATRVLNVGRLSLSSGCVGGMKFILELITAHIKGRKQFGKTINNFGLIQEKIATIAASTYATESIVYLTSGCISKGMERYHLESAICKIFASEAAWETIDSAIQMAGGCGFMREYPYERIMRDSRINLIFEGTNEILRLFVALAGVKGPAEYMKDVAKSADISKALQDPLKSLGVLTKFAGKRIEKMVLPKALSKHHGDLQEWAEHFAGMLGAFSIQVENTLIKHGRKIIDVQLPQRRLADMATQLFVMAALMARTSSILEQEGIDKEKKQYCLNLNNYACRRARYKFMANFKAMDKNLDPVVTNICQFVSQKGGYDLDILDY